MFCYLKCKVKGIELRCSVYMTAQFSVTKINTAQNNCDFDFSNNHAAVILYMSTSETLRKLKDINI